MSPFVGRLDDQSVAGLEVVRSISELYRIQGAPTQVLSASIRSVQRAVRSWYNGANVVTMPPKVFEQMYDHILTDKGLEIFDRDCEAIKSNIGWINKHKTQVLMPLYNTFQPMFFTLHTSKSSEAKRLWRQKIKEEWDYECAYCGLHMNSQ